MRKSDWIKAAAMLAGLGLTALGSYGHQQSSLQQSSSQQTGDPVADAARKAREEKEKKGAQKPKRVFTDDDVKGAAPEKPAATSGAAPTDATNATAPDAQKGDDATAKEDPNGEKAWRRRFREQHQKIANAEKELDILQRELQKSQVQYYADPTKAMTEQTNRAEINEKTSKIEAKKKELEQLRQQLDDMEAELRKAGGDSGWAQ